MKENMEEWEFISLEKRGSPMEILNLLEKKSVYSIRFHTKNNNLFYMNKTKDYIEYNFLKSKKFRKRTNYSYVYI